MWCVKSTTWAYWNSAALVERDRAFERVHRIRVVEPHPVFSSPKNYCAPGGKPSQLCAIDLTTHTYVTRSTYPGM